MTEVKTELTAVPAVLCPACGWYLSFDAGEHGNAAVRPDGRLMYFCATSPCKNFNVPVMIELPRIQATVYPDRLSTAFNQDRLTRQIGSGRSPSGDRGESVFSNAGTWEMGGKYGTAEVEYMKELGARIRSARVLNGRSRRELAGEVNSTIKQVWLYESGRGMPPAVFVYRVARVLNISRRWLLDGPKKEDQP